jgi:ribosomal subunit interface protein
MTLRVSGKNLDIGASLRTHVGTRIESVVSKFSAGLTNGHVTIEKEGSGFRTECCLHLDSGAVLQVEAEALDAYASFNMAAERAESQLRRSKRRRRLRAAAHGRDLAEGKLSAGTSAAAVGIVRDVLDVVNSAPIVIAESFDGLKEMSVSGAVRELDVSDAHIVIFRRSGDGRPNIVYRRADGNIGWIDPALSPKA